MLLTLKQTFFIGLSHGRQTYKNWITQMKNGKPDFFFFYNLQKYVGSVTSLEAKSSIYNSVLQVIGNIQ